MVYSAPHIVDALLDFYTEYTLAVIRAIRDLPFDFFYIGDDVTGFVSPEHLDALWARRHERIIRAAQETGKPVLCHCCGPQAEALPYFSRWGVDAVHPLQAGVNDIYAVRERYPNLTLVGNMDVNLLSFGSPADVAANTLEHLDRLGPAGRYVACSSHSIIDSVRPENYRAMLETAWNWRP
jgi:uroporphyrinogen-III decarboxylase